jgi:outer membrane cobalamin receptor
MRSTARSTVIVAGRAARWACALALLASLLPICADAEVLDTNEHAGDEDEEQEEDEGSEQEEGEQEEGELKVKVNVQASRAVKTFRHPASVLQVDLGNRSPGSSLADVLSLLPGLQVRRLGGVGDPAYVGIRGSSSQQVEVWVDGIPLNPLGSSSVDLSELALEDYDRIEVWRGFSPAELGGAPIGGVIHLISSPGGTVPSEVTAGAGSFATRHLSARTGSTHSAPDGGLADARINLSWKGTKGNYFYFDGSGTPSNTGDDEVRKRTNNHHDQFDLSTQLRVGTGPLLLSLREGLHWHDGGEPGPGHGLTEQASSKGLSNLSSLRAQLLPHPRLKMHAELSYLHRRARFSDRGGEIVVGALDREDRSHHISVNASGRWQATDWLQFHPNIRLMIESNQRFNYLTESSSEDPRKRASGQLGIGATASLWSNRLTILGIAELSLLHNQALGSLAFSDLSPGLEDNQQAVDFLPRLAISLQPVAPLVIRASLARGMRPPNFTELFGDRGGILGNTALLPERSSLLDASLRLNLEPDPRFSLSWEAGGFFTTTEDAIVLRANSQKLVVPINYSATRTGGIETSLLISALQRIQFSAALTWTDARIAEAETAYINNKVPFVPEWDLELGLKLRPLPWLSVHWAFSYLAGSYDSRSNLFAQAPRAIHNLELRIDPGPNLPWISVEAHNLADSTTWTGPLDPLHPESSENVIRRIEDFRGNPLPGRSILFSLGWKMSPRPSQANTR